MHMFSHMLLRVTNPNDGFNNMEEEKKEEKKFHRFAAF